MSGRASNARGLAEHELWPEAARLTPRLSGLVLGRRCPSRGAAVGGGLVGPRRPKPRSLSREEAGSSGAGCGKRVCGSAHSMPGKPGAAPRTDGSAAPDGGPGAEAAPSAPARPEAPARLQRLGSR